MYFVFAPTFRSWHRRELQAIIQNYGIDIPNVEPHWWHAQPLTVPPPPLEFAINPRAPHLGNYLTGTIFDLYSERLIGLLRGVGVTFETFPATMVHYKTGEALPLAYHVFHLLEIRPCFDLEQPVVGRYGVTKLVLTTDCVAEGRLLFRAQEHKHIVLIRQDLRDVLDAAGITGCGYMLPEEYGSTLLA